LVLFFKKELPFLVFFCYVYVMDGSRIGVCARQRGSHIPSLDGIRAIAFLIVFGSHAISVRFVPGGFGVTVFFFLSGYLITTLLIREARESGRISLRRFYLRRAIRILPPMYVTVALAYLAVWLGLIAHATSLWPAFAAILNFYNYWAILGGDQLPAGTGVVWSLMIEAHFYAVFPIIFALFVRRGWSVRRQAATLIAVCVGVLVWRAVLVFVVHVSLDPAAGWIYRATDTRFDGILWGCVMAILREDGAGVRRGRYAWVLALMGVAMIFGSLIWRNPLFRETLRYTVQSVALWPIFSFCIDRRARVLGNMLDSRVLVRIGGLSYAMYLGHVMVLELVGGFVGADGVVRAGMAFVLTLAFARVMQLGVERPLAAISSGALRLVPLDPRDRV